MVYLILFMARWFPFQKEKEKKEETVGYTEVE